MNTIKIPLAAWITGCALAAATSLQAGPKLVCPEPTLDVGLILQTDSVRHQFLLKNEGHAVLKLSPVATGCAASVSHVAREVAPGDATWVDFEAKLRGRLGAFARTANLKTNDPEHPRIALTVKGIAHALYSVTPKSLSFENVPEGQSRKMSVEVASLEEPFEILRIENPSKSLTVKKRPSRSGSGHTLQVRLKKKAPRGYHQTTIKLHTNLKDNMVIPLHVLVNVIGPVVVQPESISLKGSNSAPVNLFISLRKGTLGPFDIEAVKPPLPDMKTSVSTFRDKGHQVYVSNVFPGPELDGKKIYILTNLETLPVIEVPLLYESHAAEPETAQPPNKIIFPRLP